MASVRGRRRSDALAWRGRSYAVPVFLLCGTLVSLLSPQIACAQTPSPDAGTQQRIEEQIAALKNMYFPVRSQAIETLETIGPAAVPTLIRSLSDDNHNVRCGAAEALGKIGPVDAAVVPALVHALGDGDSNLRASAATALGRIGPAASSAISKLIQTLSDNDRNVRSRTVVALGEIGPADSSVITVLIQALRDKNSNIRSCAISTLAKITPSVISAVPALIHTLHDNSPNVRYSAASALGKIGPAAASAVPDLTHALQDDDPTVRSRSAIALGAIGPAAASAVPALIHTLNDHNFGVRSRTAEALGKIGPDAVPALIPALSDSKYTVRSGAIYALGAIGSAASPAVPALIHTLQNSDPDLRSGAASALGEIGPATATVIPALIHALNDNDLGVRCNAIAALGRIGAAASPAVIPAVIQSLNDHDAYVRSNAVDALGKIGPADPLVVSTLLRSLSDSDSHVRSSAATALSAVSQAAQAEAPTLSYRRLFLRLQQLQGIRKAVEALPATSDTDPDYSDDIQTARKTIERSMIALQREERHRPLGERFVYWLRHHPVAAFLALYLLLVGGSTGLLFALRPFVLSTLSDRFPRPVAYLLGVGFLRYHPRVLNAWVEEHAATVHDRLQERGIFNRRIRHFTHPVEWNDQVIRFDPADLQPLFSRDRAVLLIQGAEHSGKTTLAAQIALAALNENPAKRPCAAHRMLPLFFNQNLPSNTDLLTAIQTELQDLTDTTTAPPAELIRQLLRQRRLLLIADGYSERNDATRALFQGNHPTLPLDALIFTSRNDEKLPATNQEIIRSHLPESSRPI